MNKQRYLKPFVILVAAAAAAIIVLSLLRFPISHLNVRFLVLFLCTVLIGRLVVHIPSIKGELTVSDTLIFLTMLLCDGEAAILVAAVAGVCSSLRVTRKVSVHVFNLAVMTCSTFLTVITLRAVFGPIGTLGSQSLSVLLVTVMAMVQYIANSALVAIYTGCKTNKPFWSTWRKYYLWASITYLAGASAAFLIVKLIAAVGLYGMIASAPVIAIVYFTYKTYLKNVEASVAQAEQAKLHAELLQESEERFRSAFDYAAIGMALVSEEGRFQEVNHSLCQIAGYSESELLKTNIQAVIHPEDLGDVLVQQCRLRDGQVPGYQTERRYIHKSGH